MKLFNWFNKPKRLQCCNEPDIVVAKTWYWEDVIDELFRRKKWDDQLHIEGSCYKKYNDVRFKNEGFLQHLGGISVYSFDYNHVSLIYQEHESLFESRACLNCGRCLSNDDLDKYVNLLYEKYEEALEYREKLAEDSLKYEENKKINAKRIKMAKDICGLS